MYERRPLTTYDDPSGLFAALGTTLGAVLALVGLFVDLPDGFGEALLALVATLGPLVTALAIRRHAYAPATVDRERRAEYEYAWGVLDTRRREEDLEGEALEAGALAEIDRRNADEEAGR